MGDGENGDRSASKYDEASDDAEVALEHWDDDGGTYVAARPSMNISRATQPIHIASQPPL
ncbi:hypothetical protein ACIGEP_05550 [Microbacterium sp. NPDC077663]|uniref:hypothetical protein n=1 Tax=Microbacterium sp. NPDC077663 TaxID=3364189 RepID=UPI0037C6AD97